MAESCCVGTAPASFCRLTKEQALILKAASADENSAFGRWEEWKSLVDIEKIDGESVRILPALYLRLHDRVNDPFMEKLKGVYRKHWYLNQILFHEIAPILEALDSAGVRFFLAGGPALVLAHYKDSGARFVDDFEIVVPEPSVRRAVLLSKKLGWKSDIGGLRSGDISNFRTFLFWKPSENHPALRFRLSWQKPGHEFWRGTVPVKCEGRTVLVLNTTAQLFYTCAYAARWAKSTAGWRPRYLIQWMADAMEILRSAVIDWDRFSGLIENSRGGVEAKAALRDLKNGLDASIPSEIMAAAADSPAAGKSMRGSFVTGFEFWLRRAAGIFTDVAMRSRFYFQR